MLYHIILRVRNARASKMACAVASNLGGRPPPYPPFRKVEVEELAKSSTFLEKVEVEELKMSCEGGGAKSSTLLWE